MCEEWHDSILPRGFTEGEIYGNGLECVLCQEGRDFFAREYAPREFVISARDRCDYTIERVRSVTTERYKYLRNFLTDRPFMQPQYRDGRDYVEVPRQLHKEGELNSVQAFMWSQKRVPEELYDLQTDRALTLAIQP